ncbi:MAG: fibronectin type III domain-containing protein [Bacteroidales bacterium]|nr:fibronectin type III domain-containing protein [Bacteroidales bacterium]
MKKNFIRWMLLAVCALMPAWVSAQVTLPWSENFDSYTTTGGSSMPTGWNRVAPFQASSSSAVVPNLTTAYNHGTVLNFMGQGGSGDGTGTMKIATPLIPAPLNALEISFEVYKSGLTVYLATDPANESTYTLVGSYSPGFSWTTYEVLTNTLAGAPSSQGYIVFCGTYGSSGYSTAYLDNLYVTALNSCPRTDAVTVESVSPADATLSWTAVSGVTSYRVSYNTVNDLQGAMVDTATTTGITLTNLASNTQYYVWVQSLCDNGVSDPRTATFTTQIGCYPIVGLQMDNVSRSAAAFSWQYDTRGYAADGVFTILHDLTDPTVPDVEEPSTGSNCHFFTDLNPEHEYAVTFITLCDGDSSTTVDTTIVFRPCGQTALTQNNNDKSLYYPLTANYKYSYSQMVYPYSDFFDMDTIRGIVLRRSTEGNSGNISRTFSIWMGTTPNAVPTSVVSVAGMTHVAHGSHLLKAQEWDTILFNTPFVYDGASNVMVTFCDSTGTSLGLSQCPSWMYHSAEGTVLRYSYSDNNNYNPLSPSASYNAQKLPDVRFLGDCTPNANCETPVSAVLHVDSVNAMIGWAAGMGSAYVVEYRLTGTDIWMVADTVQTESYMFTNLAPSTHYEACVGVVCDFQTRYSNQLAFTTECALMHIPFHFTQTEMCAAADNGFTSCWTYSEHFYKGRLSGMSGSSNRGYVRNAGNGRWFMLPAVAEPLQGARLRSWIASSDHGYVKVGVASESNCSDVVWVDTVEIPAGNPNTSHDEYVVYLDGYEGTGNRVVVSPIVNNDYHYIYFFDFHIEPIEDCRPAEDLTLESFTANSLTLSWTPVGAASSWAVYVNGTQVGTANGTPTYTATGLAEYTDYEITVRSLCGGTDTSSAVSGIFRTGCTGESCTFTVNGHASSGEGWKGGFLSITSNNAQVATIKMLNGSDISKTIMVCAGMPLTFRWYSGNADNECSLAIVGASGDTLCWLSSAAGIDTFYVTDNICAQQQQEEEYTVTVTYDATRGNVTGAGTYPAGTLVHLTATAYDGYEFAGWSNGQTAASISFTLNSDVFMEANFAEKQGIGSVDGTTVTLAPNPVSDKLTLSGIEGLAVVTVIDLNGREMYRQADVAGSLDIDVSHLAKGVYLVRIVSDQVSATRRFVVK